MAEDFLPPPDVGPMPDLGLGPAPAPMSPVPQAPGIQSFLPKQGPASRFAPLAVLAAAILGGKGMNGLAQGYAQGQHQMGQEDLQKAQLFQQDAMRQQQSAQLQQHQADVMAQQEEARRMAALQSIKANVSKITDSKQYDQSIDAYASQMQMAGFRGVTANQLRVAAPFVAPNAKQIAGAAVNAWLKNPANAAAIKKDPTLVSKAVIQIDTNGDGVPENVPLMRAGQIGGIQFAADETGAPIALEGSSDPKVGSAFQEVYKAGLARFIADNKRQPEPNEKQKLVNDSIKAASEDARKPEAVVKAVDIKPGTREFQVAQDMAYGKLTFPMFRTIFAYSRDAGMKEAIYTKARELNPDFDPSKFEIGYKFASNPKTQNALAAVDNVMPNIDAMVRLSDSWDRTRFPDINRFLGAAQFHLGGRKIANIRQAQKLIGDELGIALGAGGMTDMKLQLGLDIVDPNLAPDVFADNMARVKDFLQNRKRSLYGRMGPYGEGQGAAPPSDAGGDWVDVGGGIKVRKKQ